MARILTPATGRRWFNGTYGNLSVSPTFSATLAAAPANDDLVFGDKVEPNVKIVGVSLLTAALGASTTVTVKVGGVAITPAISTVSAVNQYIPVDDVMTVEGQELIATIGGGAATGAVKVKLHYEMVGNL